MRSAPGFISPQLASADDVMAVGAEADVKADDVGLFEEFIQLDELDSHVFRPFCVRG